MKDSSKYRLDKALEFNQITNSIALGYITIHTMPYNFSKPPQFPYSIVQTQ